jgi:hypothetical protein
MVVAVANIVAAIGGIALIGVILVLAIRGTGDREIEEQARHYFTEHGHWPDEAPPAGHRHP